MYMYRTKKQVLESKESPPISPINLPPPAVKEETPAYWYEGFKKIKPKIRYLHK